MAKLLLIALGLSSPAWAWTDTASPDVYVLWHSSSDLNEAADRLFEFLQGRVSQDRVFGSNSVVGLQDFWNFTGQAVERVNASKGAAELNLYITGHGLPGKFICPVGPVSHESFLSMILQNIEHALPETVVNIVFTSCYGGGLITEVRKQNPLRKINLLTVTDSETLGEAREFQYSIMAATQIVEKLRAAGVEFCPECSDFQRVMRLVAAARTKNKNRFGSAQMFSTYHQLIPLRADEVLRIMPFFIFSDFLIESSAQDFLLPGLVDIVRKLRDEEGSAAFEKRLALRPHSLEIKAWIAMVESDGTQIRDLFWKLAEKPNPDVFTHSTLNVLGKSVFRSGIKEPDLELLALWAKNDPARAHRILRISKDYVLEVISKADGQYLGPHQSRLLLENGEYRNLILQIERHPNNLRSAADPIVEFLEKNPANKDEIISNLSRLPSSPDLDIKFSRFGLFRSVIDPVSNPCERRLLEITHN